MRLIESRPAIETDLYGVAHQVPLADGPRQSVSDDRETNPRACHERQRSKGVEVFTRQRAIALATELCLYRPEGPFVGLCNEVDTFIKLREAELCADLLRHFRQ